MLSLIVTVAIAYTGLGELSKAQTDDMSMNPIIMHIHPQLSLIVNGTPVVVPPQIVIGPSLWKDHSLDEFGMQSMPEMNMSAMAPLHTHDSSGIIHVESIPMDKKAGSRVIGGTINKNGYLQFTATKVGNDTVLANIIEMVQKAKMSKAPVQRIVDTAVQYFIPIVLLIAISASLYWIFLAQESVSFASWHCSIKTDKIQALMVSNVKTKRIGYSPDGT